MIRNIANKISLFLLYVFTLALSCKNISTSHNRSLFERCPVITSKDALRGGKDSRSGRKDPVSEASHLDPSKDSRSGRKDPESEASHPDPSEEEIKENEKDIKIEEEKCYKEDELARTESSTRAKELYESQSAKEGEKKEKAKGTINDSEIESLCKAVSRLHEDVSRLSNLVKNKKQDARKKAKACADLDMRKETLNKLKEVLLELKSRGIGSDKQIKKIKESIGIITNIEAMLGA